jgi:hypothetical protein
LSNVFVDATVLCNAIPLPHVSPANHALSFSALKKHSTSEAPFYALKELRGGPLSSIMLFHNLLVTKDTVMEAVHEFQTRYSHTPRKWQAASTAIIDALLRMLPPLRASGELSDAEIKQELENSLCLKITKAWQRRKAVINRFSQPLQCFVDGDIGLMDRQLRVLHGGADGCAKEARCGAALLLQGKMKEVAVLVEALRPPKAKKGEAREKTETSTRRKALKELQDKSAARFDKRYCRGIGDAYYCLMAPEGFEILTTNTVDFQPMAMALGKKLTHP